MKGDRTATKGDRATIRGETLVDGVSLPGETLAERELCLGQAAEGFSSGLRSGGAQGEPELSRAGVHAPSASTALGAVSSSKRVSASRLAGAAARSLFDDPPPTCGPHYERL